MTPRITAFAFTPRFERIIQKLNTQQRNKLLAALRKLTLVPPPRGLNIERLAGYEDVYSLRVDLHWRATFKLIGTIAHLRNYDTHDQLYRDP